MYSSLTLSFLSVHHVVRYHTHTHAHTHTPHHSLSLFLFSLPLTLALSLSLISPSLSLSLSHTHTHRAVQSRIWVLLLPLSLFTTVYLIVVTPIIVEGQ